MATFKTISSADIKSTASVLNQLIDFVEEDISGSATRKKYQVFVTSSGNNAITSSVYPTTEVLSLSPFVPEYDPDPALTAVIKLPKEAYSPELEVATLNIFAL